MSTIALNIYQKPVGAIFAYNPALASLGGDFTTNSASPVDVGLGFTFTAHASSTVILTISGAYAHSAANYFDLTANMDTVQTTFARISNILAAVYPFSYQFAAASAAGSKTFKWQVSTGAATLTIKAGAQAVVLEVA
jgi:hypothetical protein